MKMIRTYAATQAMAGFFLLGLAAAHAQGSGTTSGPAGGSTVQPQTAPDASRTSGPAGSKNGPAAKVPSGSTARPAGNAGNAAGVAGPAGSKNGPAQRVIDEP
jgi:hypothetical protein